MDINIGHSGYYVLEILCSKDMTDERLADLASWGEKFQSIKKRM